MGCISAWRYDSGKFLQLNYAHNWNDFIAALRYYVAPSQNFTYADINNNIGYYLPGKIPIREGWSGDLPINSSDNFEWREFIPFDKLPHSYNPPEGFIVSANNKIIADDYPYNLTFRCAVPPYRAQRIIDLLKAQQNLTVATMEKIQTDTVSYLWRDLRSELIKTKPLDNASQVALQKLISWDGNVSLSSTSATVFAYWYRELTQLTPAQVRLFSEWAEPLFAKQQLQTNGNYCRLANAKDCPGFLSRSLETALTKLQQQQSVDPRRWAWGKIHQTFFDEAGIGGVTALGWIWNRSIPTPGDAYTVNVGTYKYADFSQRKGPGYRQIVDLGSLDNSKFMQALGQSNNIFSAHYADLMQLWRDGKYLAMCSSKACLAKAQVLTLIPR